MSETVYRGRLPWSDEEIVISYRDAANREAQIGILAELNACTTDRIESILRAAGYDLKTTVRIVHKGKRGRWTPEETERLLELRAEGREWREIARLMGRSMQSCVSHENYLRSIKRTKTG